MTKYRDNSPIETGYIGDEWGDITSGAYSAHTVPKRGKNGMFFNNK